MYVCLYYIMFAVCWVWWWRMTRLQGLQMYPDTSIGQLTLQSLSVRWYLMNRPTMHHPHSSTATPCKWGCIITGVSCVNATLTWFRYVPRSGWTGLLRAFSFTFSHFLCFFEVPVSMPIHFAVKHGKIFFYALLSSLLIYYWGATKQI